jgi:uncharacterized protein (DUF3820 family)
MNLGEAFEPEAAVLRQRMAEELAEIARTTMPFGRFSGRRLHELPAEYLQWFVTRGWPKGRLGVLMQMVYQMKADGSEVAFDPFRPETQRLRRADV